MKSRTLLFSILACTSLGAHSAWGDDREVLDGSSKEKVPPADETSGPVIAYSTITLKNPYFIQLGDAMTAEAKKNGYQVQVFDATVQPTKQKQQIEDFIVKGVAAIVLTPCDAAAIESSINEANKAGIPVFTVDVPCTPKAKVVSHIAADNLQGGKAAGKAMIRALGKTGGDVAILDFPQAEACRLRVKGFTEVIKFHTANRKPAITIVGHGNCRGNQAAASRAMEDLLQAHRNLAGVFAINDAAALGACAAIRKSGREGKIQIVGFDGQPAGRQAIKEGKIYASPAQPIDEMGRETVRAVVRHLKGGKVKPVILVPTKLYRKSDALADKSLK